MIRVAPAGSTSLTALARRYNVPGGAATLAALNHLRDPDVSNRDAPILVPDLPTTSRLPMYEAPTPSTDPLAPCAVDEWPAIEFSDDGSNSLRSPPTSTTIDSESGGERPLLTIEHRSSRLNVMRIYGSALLITLNNVPILVGRSEFPVRPIRIFTATFGDREATVIASHVATSNGIGVSTWSLYIVSEGHVIIRDGIHQFTPASFVRNEQGSCDLLLTNLNYLIEPTMGSGEYLVGQRFQLGDGGRGDMRAVGPYLFRRLGAVELDDGTGAHMDDGARWLSERHQCSVPTLATGSHFACVRTSARLPGVPF